MKVFSNKSKFYRFISLLIVKLINHDVHNGYCVDLTIPAHIIIHRQKESLKAEAGIVRWPAESTDCPDMYVVRAPRTGGEATKRRGEPHKAGGEWAEAAHGHECQHEGESPDQEQGNRWIGKEVSYSIKFRKMSTINKFNCRIRIHDLTSGKQSDRQMLNSLEQRLLYEQRQKKQLETVLGNERKMRMKAEEKAVKW